MTFAEYIEAIEAKNTIYSIEHYRNERLITTYSYSYIGYRTDKNPDFYGFYCCTNGSKFIAIDPMQEIAFQSSGNGIIVNDGWGNVVELVFYKASPIENPLPNWRDVS